MRISDWSSDVCSSDLVGKNQRRIDAPATLRFPFGLRVAGPDGGLAAVRRVVREIELRFGQAERARHRDQLGMLIRVDPVNTRDTVDWLTPARSATRSEEHTSELQSLMRISYAVFCL